MLLDFPLVFLDEIQHCVLLCQAYDHRIIQSLNELYVAMHLVSMETIQRDLNSRLVCVKVYDEVFQVVPLESINWS